MEKKYCLLKINKDSVAGDPAFSQLLDHSQRIFETLTRGDNKDVSYFVSPKIFDKADDNIVLRKIRHFFIKGNVYEKIKKKFCQVENKQYVLKAWSHKKVR